MPRKISTEGRPVDATGTVLKAVRLELSPETHRALRIEAARQDKSMAALVRTWVEENLAKLKKAGGK
jgi:predicted HicB family RNase H-like nuclease